MTESPSHDEQSTQSIRDSKAHDRRITALYNEHSAPLTKWLLKRFGSGPPEPEDVVQITFTKLAESNSIDEINNIRAYLFTMASNIAVSAIRKNVRGRSFLRNELQKNGNDVEEITPERVLQQRDELNRVAEAFQQLTPRQKEIVRRSRLHGHTYERISQDKGWSLGTISSDMKAAMIALASSPSDS